MRELVCVFVGGGIGSVARYMVSILWRHIMLNPRYCNIVFPWATFIVNILGCFLIGLFYHYSDQWGMSHAMRLLITIGLCGGFTTFSTFSYESMSLIQSGHISMCIVYIAGSILLGILAVSLPYIISHI